MKITVSSIPLEGRTFELTSKTGWIREIVASALAEQNPAVEGLNGNLKISRVDKNVSLRGRLNVDLNPVCDRCLQSFVWPLCLDIHIDFSPKSGSSDNRSGQEIELTPDDLNFSFYRGLEIDVGEVIREQLILALPIRFICAEECHGLCPQCGADLNLGKCGCVA
ncbi:MAG: DUF177 domain-containing protein [Deltaproteobacteria bacterium]|nr:DUF177 domain-containing protein [Deltaproteobacteria bacterium]